MNKNTPMRYVCELVLFKVYNWREITCMEVTFTVSKWDEKPIDDTRKDFPINIAHVEYDIDGELKGKAFVEYLLYYLDSNINDGHLATAKISGFTL